MIVYFSFHLLLIDFVTIKMFKFSHPGLSTEAHVFLLKFQLNEKTLVEFLHGLA